MLKEQGGQHSWQRMRQGEYQEIKSERERSFGANDLDEDMSRGGQ